jgi:hypothetical protein
VSEGGVEGVTTYDLVQVRRGDGIWCYERVETLNDELRALKTEHGRNDESLAGDMVGEKTEGEVVEVHGC